MAMWEDQIVDYHAEYVILGSPQRKCGTLRKDSYMKFTERLENTFLNLSMPLTMVACHTWDAADALCEFTDDSMKDRTSTGLGSRQLIPFAVPSQSTGFGDVIRYTVCAQGHVTHSFLATDKQSRCWTEGQLRERLEIGQNVQLEEERSFQVKVVGMPQTAPGNEKQNPARDLSLSSPIPDQTDHFVGLEDITVTHSPDVDPETARRSSKDTPVARRLFLPPMFSCLTGLLLVPYTMVCDFRRDCSDSSDEDFCVYQTCAGDTPFTCSDGKQCYSLSERCNGYTWCVSGGDEGDCSNEGIYGTGVREVRALPPPAIIDFSPESRIVYRPLNVSSSAVDSPPCPETHFQCVSNSDCLPVFLRCNGIYDCPGKEDEAECERAECPGFYRCRASPVCLHVGHLCDGLMQCPRGDDELSCAWRCPDVCSCHGLAFLCPAPFHFREHVNLRYLDASDSQLTTDSFSGNTMLVFLRLARCLLTKLHGLNFPNLFTLDVSENLITDVSLGSFSDSPNLRSLVLASNPIHSLFLDQTRTNGVLQKTVSLDLSSVPLGNLDMDVILSLHSLDHLNLSNAGVSRVLSTRSWQNHSLTVLDVRGCPMSDFPRLLFKALGKLKLVLSDNYKLCCAAVLPEHFDLRNCHSPVNEISSCADLLRYDINRIFLAIFSALALTLNLASFCLRLREQVMNKFSAYGVLVLHLCVSDWLMGAYLAFVLGADTTYRGQFLWQEETWRHSTVCKVAGFLALVSCEMSAFVICIITLDRFLVLRFPFSRAHFEPKSANTACCLLWLLGLVLAGVPLLPWTSHWELYSQTAVCMPLPFTRQQSPGYYYAFAVIIVLNLSLFMLTALGQSAVYMAIRTNTITTTVTSHAARTTRQNMNVARRLITVALTDFVCWVPVAVIGILATLGVPIPSEVYIVTTTFIMPLNSAVNPFLYTLNLVLEQRRKDREQKLLAWFKSNQQLANR